MSAIGTRFDGHEWQLRMPQLVRYVGKQHYVEEFFDEGRLISSFEAFREYAGKDGERGDWSEGRFEGRVANMAIAAMNGETAYVLCTCAVERGQRPALKRYLTSWSTSPRVFSVKPNWARMGPNTRLMNRISVSRVAYPSKGPAIDSRSA